MILFKNIFILIITGLLFSCDNKTVENNKEYSLGQNVSTQVDSCYNKELDIGKLFKYEFIEDSSEFILKIGERKINYNVKSLIESGFKVSFDIICIENGFDIVYQLQNGNDYQIFHNQFIKSKNNFILQYQYTEYSSRVYYYLHGNTIENNIIIEQFSFNDDYLKDAIGTGIINRSGFQEEEVIDSIDFSKLINENIDQKKIIAMLTNELVIEKVGYKGTRELKEIGKILLENELFEESISIFKKIIQIDKSEYKSYLSLSKLYEKIGNQEKAKEYLDLYNAIK